jgi:hypothetical protein
MASTGSALTGTSALATPAPPAPALPKEPFLDQVGEVLGAAEGFTDALAANFSRDPAVRAQFRQKQFIEQERKTERAEKRLQRSLDFSVNFAEALAHMTPEQFASSGAKQKMDQILAGLADDLVRGAGFKKAEANAMVEGRRVSMMAKLGSALESSKPPVNFEPDPDRPGAVRPIPGGPADPATIARETFAGTTAREAATLEEEVVNLRDASGNVRTILIDSKTGETIRELSVGPEVTFQPPDLPGTKVMNEIESALVEGGETMARLRGIQQEFKPEFLQLFPRLKVKGLAAMEKLGLTLSPEQQARVGEYSAFARKAIRVVNLEIKNITGAQMSEAEAERLRRGVPDPDNDSPSQFVANLNDTIKTVNASMFRMEGLRKLGFASNKISPTLAQQFPLERYLPPAEFPDAALVGTDESGNPVFTRLDEATGEIVTFAVVP